MSSERPVAIPTQSSTPEGPGTPEGRSAEPDTERLTAVGGGTHAPTELRVHGVSGTPAEEMLDRPLIRRVAGDREAGFFRPRAEYGATHGSGGAQLEAFRWGNLTAGAAARAFWLLLLPFTLANVPMWLRPAATGFGRRIVHGLCRIFALTISGTFTLAAAGIFLDLVAWQCAEPGSPCLQRRAWLAPFFTGFFEPTGRRLALAMVGPVLVIAVLWILAIRSWARYESYDQSRSSADGDGLATPSFWSGQAQVGRLRSLHIAAMLATVDAMVLFVLRRHDAAEGSYAGVSLGRLDESTVVNVGQGLFYAALGVIGLATVGLLLPSMVDRVSSSRPASATATGLRWAGLVLTTLTFAYAMLPRAPWPAAGPLPGYAATVTGLFTVQAAILALLVLVVLAQRHRAKGALLGGFGTPVVASLALGLGAAFSAGASYRVADYLDGGAVPSPSHFAAEPQLRTLQPPVQYEWAAIGFLFMVLVALVAVMWVLLVSKPLLTRRARADTDDDHPGGRSRNPRRAADIDEAIANARLTDHVGRAFGAAWLVVAAAGVAATAFALAGIGPVQLAPSSGSVTADVLSVASNTGTYLISLAVLGLALLGVQTYRNARVRRTVGVIWDLATFWPRAAHPLAPPCYAERAVPELVHRATWLATEQGGVVLSGHSQGSVLAAATVLQLPPEARARTALLTYGSPLTRLYQRAFPTYFSMDVLRAVAAAVSDPNGQPRWVNLWRATDPIGGPIGEPVGVGDRRLADPVAFDPLPGDHLPPAVEAHSGYQVTSHFGQAMIDLVGLMQGPPLNVSRGKGGPS